MPLQVPPKAHPLGQRYTDIDDLVLALSEASTTAEHNNNTCSTRTGTAGTAPSSTPSGNDSSSKRDNVDS